MSVEDVGAIVVICFVTAIILLVIGGMGINLANSFKASAANTTQTAGQFDSMIKTSAKLDWVFLGVFIGLLLALIITAWFIAGNPIFMSLYFLAVILFVSVSIVLANVWENLLAASFFSDVISYYPIINFVMSYLPYFVAVCSMIGLIVMFAKPQGE